ncbi:MAG: flagellar biosynthesis protein FlhB [Caulobacter sp.]|nr:flagellar biosynthesis protein FlhB [Caulobacter sp.]
MAGENESASKTEEPTPKKLEEGRKKGDVPKSQDVTQLSSLLGAFAVLAIGGGWLVRDMAVGLLPFIAHPADIDVSGGGVMIVTRQAALAATPLLATVLAGAALAGVAGNLFQTGLLWTGEKMKPSFKKISPMEGFKRIFGVDGLVQFIKSAAKVLLTAGVAWMALKGRAVELSELAAMEPSALLPLGADLLKALFYAVLTFLAVTAGADWMWQRMRFTKRMRMSREELKDEYKQSDGDPHIKAKQKQMRAERARRRMMQNVAKATVVVMNPTHYAVALRYEAGEGGAPMCVAKGLDEVALRIRAVAEENDVPIIEDPPLARALYAAVELDQQIPESHFEAVAKIIGFIMAAAQRRQVKSAGPRARAL